jgi:hypothetical protein
MYNSYLDELKLGIAPKYEWSTSPRAQAWG